MIATVPITAVITNIPANAPIMDITMPAIAIPTPSFDLRPIIPITTPTIEAIKGLRNLRQSLNVPAGSQIDIKIYGEYRNVYLSKSDYQWLLARIPSEKVLNKYIEDVKP